MTFNKEPKTWSATVIITTKTHVNVSVDAFNGATAEEALVDLAVSNFLLENPSVKVANILDTSIHDLEVE